MIQDKEKATPQALKRELADLARRLDIGKIEESMHFPKYFQVETTRLCNARCPFCAIDLWDKSTPFMSDELYKKVADEIIEFRDWVKFVDLQRAGEPLLDRKIYERIAYMKDRGVPFVAITTNASGLNKRNATRLLEAGIDEVMLSIDSVEKQRYEKLRVGLEYEQVLENIVRFFSLRDQIRPGCIVRVRGVSFHDMNNPDDVKDITDWEGFWAKLRKPHDRIYMKRAHNWGNQKEIDGHSPEYHWVYHPCIIPWSTMHITAMGKVALCPQDFDATVDFGDINTQSIVEVWRGPKMQEMRRLHATGARNQVKLCQGCRIFDEEFSLERDKDVAKDVFDDSAVRRRAKRLV